MVDLNEEFDTNADENQGFPVPDSGEYRIMMTDSKLVPTKKAQIIVNPRTGEEEWDAMILNCTFQILEGKYKNQNLFHMFNWKNPNATAQQIGRSQFAECSKACGKTIIKRTEDLYSIPLRSIIVKEETPGYGPQARIKSFKPDKPVANAKVAAAKEDDLPDSFGSKEESPKKSSKKKASEVTL